MLFTNQEKVKYDTSESILITNKYRFVSIIFVILLEKLNKNHEFINSKINSKSCYVRTIRIFLQCLSN